MPADRIIRKENLCAHCPSYKWKYYDNKPNLFTVVTGYCPSCFSRKTSSFALPRCPLLYVRKPDNKILRIPEKELCGRLEILRNSESGLCNVQQLRDKNLHGGQNQWRKEAA
jgi:hypothetical protein